MNTWIPIADQYNEWMFLGPKRLKRCEKLSESEGPPFWAPKACQINFNPPQETQKKTVFCATRKGYFCCNKTASINQADPHSKSIYIFTRTENNSPQYLFTRDEYLNERMWKKDQGSWRKSGKLEGDVSKITLMSGYVRGRFEDPVYFCYRPYRNSGNLVTTQHKVSKTWCEGRWSFNFFMYGNYSNDAANDTELQRLIVGNSPSKVKHSRISLQESRKFPEAFSIYGPSHSSNPHHFTHRNRIEDDDACNGKTVILNTKTGIITSPAYPSKYNTKIARNVNCTWKIVGPFGAIVKISFKSMKLSAKKKRAAPLVVSFGLRT